MIWLQSSEAKKGCSLAFFGLHFFFVFVFSFLFLFLFFQYLQTKAIDVEYFVQYTIYILF